MIPVIFRGRVHRLKQSASPVEALTSGPCRAVALASAARPGEPRRRSTLRPRTRPGLPTPLPFSCSARTRTAPVPADNRAPRYRPPSARDAGSRPGCGPVRVYEPPGRIPRQARPCGPHPVTVDGRTVPQVGERQPRPPLRIGPRPEPSQHAPQDARPLVRTGRQGHVEPQHGSAARLPGTCPAPRTED